MKETSPLEAILFLVCSGMTTATLLAVAVCLTAVGGLASPLAWMIYFMGGGAIVSGAMTAYAWAGYKRTRQQNK